MLKVVNEQVETMQIKFEGTNDIDIETLAVALKNTVSSLKIIADEILDEKQYCKFKIKDVKKGSFILDIAAFTVSNYSTIFQNIPTVLSTFKTILDIKKHLGGNEPKSVKQIDEHNVEVINNNGNIINANKAVVNIYATNAQIEKSLSSTFNKVFLDNDRNGMTFSIGDDSEISTTVFESEDINKAKNSIDVSSLVNDIEENVTEAVLTVVKPDLYGNSKWQVFFNTMRIYVDIKDESFLNRVHNYEISFKASTRLKVKLRTRYKINGLGLPIEGSETDYAVIEVLEILDIQQIENIKLFS